MLFVVVRFKRELDGPLYRGFVEDITLDEVFGKYEKDYGVEVPISPLLSEAKTIRERDSDSALWDLLTVTASPLAFKHDAAAATNENNTFFSFDSQRPSPLKLPRKLVNSYSTNKTGFEQAEFGEECLL